MAKDFQKSLEQYGLTGDDDNEPIIDDGTVAGDDF